MFLLFEDDGYDYWEFDDFGYVGFDCFYWVFNLLLFVFADGFEKGKLGVAGIGMLGNRDRGC